MSLASLYDNVGMTTATVGTGTITLGSAITDSAHGDYLTFAEAGVPSGTVVSYRIEDGNNFEIGTGTYTSAGTTLTRGATLSKTTGTKGTTAISLSGSAKVYIVLTASQGLSLGAGGLNIDSTGTLSSPTMAAGTSSKAALAFTSGTNMTTPTAGSLEFDGNVVYATTLGSSNRGVVMTEAIQVLSGAYTLTSQTAAQKLFNATTNGAVTLPIGVYHFECLFSLTSMSASSGSFGFALGGTATFTQAWHAEANKSALATASAGSNSFNTAANTTLIAVNTTTTGYAIIHGIIRVSVSGTIIPQVSLGVAAAAIVGANSFFRITPIGGSGATSIGNWS
jgi:hypothetical protein